MKTLILFFFICVSCRSAIFFSEVDNSLGRELIKYDSLQKSITKTNQLPKGLVSFLKERGINLASSDKMYNETDLVINMEIPNAKIILSGWVDKGLGVLVYENLGIKEQSNFMIFKYVSNRKVVYYKGYFNCRPNNFSDMKFCLAK